MMMMINAVALARESTFAVVFFSDNMTQWGGGWWWCWGREKEVEALIE